MMLKQQIKEFLCKILIPAITKNIGFCGIVFSQLKAVFKKVFLYFEEIGLFCNRCFYGRKTGGKVIAYGR
jgi:hypothetical protein